MTRHISLDLVGGSLAQLELFGFPMELGDAAAHFRLLVARLAVTGQVLAKLQLQGGSNPQIAILWWHQK